MICFCCWSCVLLALYLLLRSFRSLSHSRTHFFLRVNATTFRLLNLQACLAEQEEKERSATDPTSPRLIPTLALPTDDEASQSVQPVEPTRAHMTLDLGHEPTDSAVLVAQSTVQKTTRVIRRTILQNGREISVEEQVQEDDRSVKDPKSSQKRKTARPAAVQIPSPFGVVEEPTFPEDEPQKPDEKGSVEITDVTDQYKQDEGALPTVEDSSSEADNPTASTDEIVEIHEVLEDVPSPAESPKVASDVVEVSHDVADATSNIRRQTSVMFETLQEHEEEAEDDYKESTGADEKDSSTSQSTRESEKISLDEPTLAKGSIPVDAESLETERSEEGELKMAKERRRSSSRHSSSSSDSSTSTNITLLEPEATLQQTVTKSDEPDSSPKDLPPNDDTTSTNITLLEPEVPIQQTVSIAAAEPESSQEKDLPSYPTKEMSQLTEDQTINFDQVAEKFSEKLVSEVLKETIEIGIAAEPTQVAVALLRLPESKTEDELVMSVSTTNLDDAKQSIMSGGSLDADELDQRGTATPSTGKASPEQSESKEEHELEAFELLKRTEEPSSDKVTPEPSENKKEQEPDTTADAEEVTSEQKETNDEHHEVAVATLESSTQPILVEDEPKQTAASSSELKEQPIESQKPSSDDNDMPRKKPEPKSEKAKKKKAKGKKRPGIPADTSKPLAKDDQPAAEPSMAESSEVAAVAPTVDERVTKKEQGQVPVIPSATEPEAEEKVVQLAESIVNTLPDLIHQLVNAENLLASKEDSIETDDQADPDLSKEEELAKERGDALNTLMEHRGSLAPTLGDNTPGPPEGEILEQEVSPLSEERATSEHMAEQEELQIQWQEIQELLAERLDHLRQGASSSTHTSSVRYLATVTQVTVNESVEERVVKLNDNLEALKTAVQRREVVVIQRIVITIVRTVTEWLETIEYRVYTIKQTKSMDRRIEQIQSLSEEVRVVEETLHTLEEVTEMAVEVVNEETKLLLHKCVKSLKEQVQSVREVTKRSEEEMELIQQRWDVYLTQISTEQERIKDVALQLEQLQSADQQTIQEKLMLLEDIETTVQERLRSVTELLQSGSELVKEAPFYQVPEAAYELLDSINSLEKAVKEERDRLVNKAALTAEYLQTLDEFEQIANLSEALAESKLAASTPDEASQELEKRQRFLFCLSHFLQVLDELEPHLDPATRCQDLHSGLVAKAVAILDHAVSRHESVEMALVSWSQLEQAWLQEDDWFNELQHQLPDLSNGISAQNFAALDETFKVCIFCFSSS